MGSNLFYQLKKSEGEQQIICFPYLGGFKNSFYNLGNAFNKEIDIWAANPPGHGGSKLNLIEDINELVDLYYTELKDIIKPQCIFFGHSMGGVIAYFLTQKIISLNEYKYKPKSLVLSACSTPSDFYIKKYSNLSDDELINQLSSYGGIPTEILDEKDFLNCLLPVFRADYRILESASKCDYINLDVPTYLLWGEKDKIVTIDLVTQWSNYFNNVLEIIPIKDGNHMFIYDKASIIVNHLQNIFDSPA